MADIELVIKIPEKVSDMAKTSPNYYPAYLFEKIWKSIVNGTPLPKGHGDLVDRNDLSLMTVHLIDGVFLCDAPTIIEADKTKSEG